MQVYYKKFLDKILIKRLKSEQFNMGHLIRYLLFVLRIAIQARFVSSDNTLGFFVKEKPIYIFESISHSQLSFVFAIPDFATDQITNMLNQIDLNLLKLNLPIASETNHQNSLMVLKMSSDIIETFRAMRKSLDSITVHKKLYETSPIKTSVDMCTSTLLQVLGEPTLKAYNIDLQTLGDEINWSLTSDQLNNDNEEYYAKLRNTLQEILDKTQQLNHEVDQYLSGLQSLSKLKLNQYLLDLLEQTDCFKNVKNPNYVSLQECEFFSTNVTCTALIRSPSNRKKLFKLVPIPYFGYEIDLPNFFLNQTSNTLLQMLCKYDNPVLLSCTKINSTKNACIKALEVGYFSLILKDCTFKETKLQQPILVQDGVLIPNADKQLFSINADGNKDELKLFKNHTPPAIIACSFKIAIVDNLFSYIFDGINNANVIMYSKFSEEQLGHLNEMLFGEFYWLDEWLSIILQSSLGGMASILSVIVITLGVKNYRGRRALRAIRQTNPPPRQYSRELTKFLKNEENKSKQNARRQN